MLTYDEVTKLASNMGTSAGRGVMVGVSADYMRAMLHEGAPLMVESPSWLSGEWSGESMTELLALTGDENPSDIDDMLTHFEEVADSAYWFEIERACLLHTTEG